MGTHEGVCEGEEKGDERPGNADAASVTEGRDGEEAIEEDGKDDAAARGAGDDEAGREGTAASEVVADDGEGGKEEESDAETGPDALREEYLKSRE